MVTGWAVDTHAPGWEPIAPWIFALVVPYVIARMLLPEAFCGWN
jgi:hypothetical protein